MFEYKLTFKLENNILPLNIGRLLVSYIKAAAQSYSQDFFDALYDKSSSIMKMYCFSYYLPGARFTKDTIELSRNEFSILFSDADEAELLRFFNGFQKMKYQTYPMNKNSMQLVSIQMRKLNAIVESEIIIKMQSPLVVRKHNSMDNTDMYYTCDMEGFSEVLKENVKFFLQKMNLLISADDFSIQPLKGKKVVANVFGRKVDTSIGVYRLTGSPELLNLLYLAGLGTRRSAGYGKFELVC